MVERVRESSHLRAVIVRVTSGDQEVLTEAVGESMTGVPATTDMHFRNGAVASPMCDVDCCSWRKKAR